MPRARHGSAGLAGRRWAACVCACFLAACSDAQGPYFGSTTRVSRDPATFYVNAGNEPEYLDPGKCAEGVCAALVVQLFEGLTRHHPQDGRPVQGVAESWEKSDDNRLFRFHLRDSARWSDGRPVTAQDFEYAWKRSLRPATASRAAGNLYVILNAEPFRLGKLRALAAPRALLAEPRAGAAEVARIEQGAAVMIRSSKDGFAEVERWSRLPTFGRAPLAVPPARGWVREADLVEDDRVLGVRATDDRTLEVELDRPAPYFLDLTSHQALAPVRRDVVEAFERRGQPDLWTRPESIVTNGAYTLDHWTFHYEIAMKANPCYWDRDRIKIKRIVWLEVEDTHATINLYKAGELDTIGDGLSLPAEYQALLSSRKDYLRSDYLAAYWYELNTRRPPLDDVRVRRALALAVDRRQIVDRITRGGQAPATHYVPDATGSGYAEERARDRAAGADPFAVLRFDPEEGRRLLAEAGYPPVREGDGWQASGFPSIEIVHNTGEGHRNIAVAIQSMWKENLGVSVTVRSEEWKVMLKDLRDHNYQIARGGYTADFNHPASFLRIFGADDPQNGTGWRDESFERAMEKAARAADPAESLRLYREAERIAVEAVPRIPLYFNTRSTLVKPWVKGFWGSPHSPHAIQFLWIDQAFQQGSPNTPAYAPLEWPAPGAFTP